MYSIHLILFINLILVSYSVLAEYDKWNGVAFSADLTVFYPSQPQNTEKSKVYYSKLGTRVEIGEGEAKNISIVNYKKEKCWFIQEKENTYNQVDLDIKTGTCSMPEIAGFKPELRNPGIFFPKPCYSYTTMKPVGKETVVGRRTSQWECTDNKTGRSSKQWYDPTLRMVVREITGNGKIIEATNIKLAREPDDALLAPNLISN